MSFQIEEYSLFVTRIEEAMRPLLGVIESSEIKKYSLQAANSIYEDRKSTRLNSSHRL